mmetsp:Transcript_23370/g.59930  ORF Transcript_23370/g.59930 Transcript_23370/m.59930 type:complete len:282 (+) Transcript_23370:133-978(+)
MSSSMSSKRRCMSRSRARTSRVFCRMPIALYTGSGLGERRGSPSGGISRLPVSSLRLMSSSSSFSLFTSGSSLGSGIPVSLGGRDTLKPPGKTSSAGIFPGTMIAPGPGGGPGNAPGGGGPGGGPGSGASPDSQRLLRLRVLGASAGAQSAGAVGSAAAAGTAGSTGTASGGSDTAAGAAASAAAAGAPQRRRRFSRAGRSSVAAGEGSAAGASGAAAAASGSPSVASGTATAAASSPSITAGSAVRARVAGTGYESEVYLHTGVGFRGEKIASLRCAKAI